VTDRPTARPGRRLRARARYRRILAFGLRMMLQTWWFDLVLPRLGLRAWSHRGQTARLTRSAARFRRLATDLGGLMIKVGQFMSTRIDMLPTEVTDQLAALQDAVPAAPFDRVQAQAEADLGMPLDRAFAAFTAEPIAAASLGQAYRARLTVQDATAVGYSDVVVKVQRPGIADIVEVDLAALRKIAGWLARLSFVSDRADVPALIEEFARTSHEEIDYLHEAAEAERFSAEFRTASGAASGRRDGAGVPCRAPQVVWERSTRRVLTLQDVTAVKINDVAALRDLGIDPSAVAGALAESMFTQLFDNGHFHADPHPGNIFVTPGLERGEFSLTFIDFGMTGTIDDTLRRGLTDLVIAVGTRDGAGMVDAMAGLGVLLPSADTTVLAEAMTELFDRFGGMAVADLQHVDPKEFEEFAHRFRDVIRTMPFQLPENFLLIMRAVSMLSGLCSTLDPQFNIWESVTPFATRLIRDRAGASATQVARRAVSSVAGTAKVITRLPGRLDHVITVVEDGDLSVNTPQVEHQLKRLERAAVRVVAAIVFVGLVVGGAVLRGSAGAGDSWSTAANVVGIVMMGFSALPLLYAVVGGRRVR
jgi:predicted unusual protein kinase regulating ubiquinone biosynthesis (AarF/ABC1/UbiB family)